MTLLNKQKRNVSLFAEIANLTVCSNKSFNEDEQGLEDKSKEL